MSGGPEPDAWAEEAGAKIAEALAEAASATEGRVSLVVAGGSTPGPVYRWLTEAGGVSWDRIDIYFGDERCVPPEDPDSNYRMVRESLLEPAGITSERVHRMEAERTDRDAAAAEYAECLPDRLDVLLLGMGEEGHTLSLFPGSPALRERVRLVVPVTTPKPPPDRLTLTPPAVERAKRIFVLARGDKKADAVARALDGPLDVDACPIQLARAGDWLLDPAAAGRVGRAR